MARQITIDDREYIEIVDKNGTKTGGFMWNPSDFDIIKRAEAVQKKFGDLDVPASDDPEALGKMTAPVKELFDELLNSKGASEELLSIQIRGVRAQTVVSSVSTFSIS